MCENCYDVMNVDRSMIGTFLIQGRNGFIVSLGFCYMETEIGDLDSK